MDLKKLNQEIINIIETRHKLTMMDYANPDYDGVEDELHDLEDNLLEEFGEYLEDCIGDIYEENCPDVDVLAPIAYIAQKYYKNKEGDFVVLHRDAVFVEIEEFPGEDSRMAILPNPLRMWLFPHEDDKGKVIYSFS